MALKIKSTPTLNGKEAKNFLYELRNNESGKTPVDKINNNINLFISVLEKNKK